MRYKIFGKLVSGLNFTEYCIPKRLGVRITELQDAGVEIIRVSQEEDYVQESKTYSWTGNSYLPRKFNNDN